MDSRTYCLAICLRAGVASLVVLRSECVHEVQQILVRHACQDKDTERVITRARKLVTDYRIANIVFDGSRPIMQLAEMKDANVHMMDVREAKSLLLACRCTHAELFFFLVTRNPELRRFVTTLHYGEVATWDRRRTVVLLAAALGLAEQQTIKQITHAYENLSTTADEPDQGETALRHPL